MTRDQLEGIGGIVEAVLEHVEEHGLPKFNYRDLDNGHRDQIARMRRNTMGLD